MGFEQPQAPKPKTWEETPETPVFYEESFMTEENAQMLAKNDSEMVAKLYLSAEDWLLKAKRKSEETGGTAENEAAIEDVKKWEKQIEFYKRIYEIKHEATKN